MRRTAQPSFGRLCLRRNRHGTMLVGVLHFGQGVEIVEGAAYLARLDQEGLVLCDKLDSELSPERADDDVSSLMQAPIWYRMRDARYLTVRFFHAFPEQNGWTVFGVSELPLSVERTDTDHTWLDVHSGTCKNIEPPMRTEGLAVSQILNLEPVWPGPDGQQYTLPSIALATRHRYLALNKLGAQLGGGLITAERFKELVNDSGEFDSIRPFPIDMDYMRHLHRLQQAGRLTLNRPMSTVDHNAHEVAVNELVRGHLAA